MFIKSLWNLIKPWPTPKYGARWRNDTHVLSAIAGAIDGILLILGGCYLILSMYILNWAMHHVLYAAWQKYVFGIFGNSTVMRIIDMGVLGIVALAFWVYLMLIGYRLHQITRKHTVLRLIKHTDQIIENRRYKTKDRDIY